MKCKVVRVKRLEFGDVCNINESDFDEKLHELYVEGEDTTTYSEDENVKTKVPTKPKGK